jgi:catechol-2,3-dioxygenase
MIPAEYVPACHYRGEKPMPPTTVVQPTLHHVNLKTHRLQEMIDWYSLVLGMSATHQFEGGA